MNLEKAISEQLGLLEDFVLNELEVQSKIQSGLEQILDGVISPIYTADDSTIIQMCSSAIVNLVASQHKVKNLNSLQDAISGNVEYFVYEVLYSRGRFTGAISWDDARIEFSNAREFAPALMRSIESHIKKSENPQSLKEVNDLVQELNQWKSRFNEINTRFTNIDNHYQEQIKELKQHLKNRDDYLLKLKEVETEISKLFDSGVFNRVANGTHSSQDLIYFSVGVHAVNLLLKSIKEKNYESSN